MELTKTDLLATMQAIAIERFGGIEQLKLVTLPLPKLNANEVMIQMEAAGVGSWDPFEREGGFAKKLGIHPKFPYVLGSDGAGTVVGIGANVRRFAVGDQVYAFTQMTPKGGFYAQYAVAQEGHTALIPAGLSVTEAGAMPVDAMTALRGLDDTLHVKPGDSIMIFGASGGVGRMAVQLGKRVGARVFAVASGSDGVKLAQELGADVAIDGRSEDVVAAARAFAPAGLDAALMTAGGAIADQSLAAVRSGGHVAYPSGCPAPASSPEYSVHEFSGFPDAEATDRLNSLIGMGPCRVVIARTFALRQAAEAHEALGTNLLGKLILVPR